MSTPPSGFEVANQAFSIRDEARFWAQICAATCGKRLLIEGPMQPQREAKQVRKVHEFVQSVCGLYSRVARKLRVSPSFVSRVARGERESPAVEQAVIQEFAEAKADLIGGKL